MAWLRRRYVCPSGRMPFTFQGGAYTSRTSAQWVHVCGTKQTVLQFLLLHYFHMSLLLNEFWSGPLDQVSMMYIWFNDAGGARDWFWPSCPQQSVEGVLVEETKIMGQSSRLELTWYASWANYAVFQKEPPLHTPKSFCWQSEWDIFPDMSSNTGFSHVSLPLSGIPPACSAAAAVAIGTFRTQRRCLGCAPGTPTHQNGKWSFAKTLTVLWICETVKENELWRLLTLIPDASIESSSKQIHWRLNSNKILESIARWQLLETHWKKWFFCLWPQSTFDQKPEGSMDVVVCFFPLQGPQLWSGFEAQRGGQMPGAIHCGCLPGGCRGEQ